MFSKKTPRWDDDDIYQKRNPTKKNQFKPKSKPSSRKHNKKSHDEDEHFMNNEQSSRKNPFSQRQKNRLNDKRSKRSFMDHTSSSKPFNNEKRRNSPDRQRKNRSRPTNHTRSQQQPKEKNIKLFKLLPKVYFLLNRDIPLQEAIDMVINRENLEHHDKARKYFNDRIIHITKQCSIDLNLVKRNLMNSGSKSPNVKSKEKEKEEEEKTPPKFTDPFNIEPNYESKTSPTDEKHEIINEEKIIDINDQENN